MTEATRPTPLAQEKFSHPDLTASGERRARVALGELRTLWFNTGTQCNLTCAHCYIESSPTNDRLVYLSAAEAATYLDEIPTLGWNTSEIGFTGGEPFMNPEFIAMLGDALARGYRTLVLTNAMRPMMKYSAELLALRKRHGDRIMVRVSIDHYSRALHEQERGPRSWEPMLAGLRWLWENQFTIHIAGRTTWGESEERLRTGFNRMLAAHGISLDVQDPAALMLFPEMDERADVPEITEACWGILGVDPANVMCASSRMVVKRKGAKHPAVLACTLLPYDPQFELGHTLSDAPRSVSLNHPHCAKFCVLGGGSCTAGE